MTSDTDGGGPELFRLVRYWSRRWAARAADGAPEPPGGRVLVQHVQVVEAVDAAGVAGAAGVPAVADQLGVDRSVASRMIAEAESAGYVRREGAPGDGRRVLVRLTGDGRDLLGAARRWQQSQFDELVAGWPAADRRRLAGYLRRLAAGTLGGP